MATSGLFDDLLKPGQATAPAGQHQAPAAPIATAPAGMPRQADGHVTSGLFDDVLGPTGTALRGLANRGAAPDYSAVFKSEPTLGEAAMRHYAQAGERFIGLANLAGMVPAAIGDQLHGLVTGRNETGLRDRVGGMTADAYQRADALGLNPQNERYGLGTELVAGLAGAAPDIAGAVLTGGESAAPRLAAPVESLGRMVMDHLGETALTAGRASLEPGMTHGADVGRQVLEHGGSTPQATGAAINSGLATGISNVLPLSASGSVLMRMAQGAAANPVADYAQTQLENAALPADMQQDYTAKDALLSALTGIPMAGFLGERGHEPLQVPEGVQAPPPAAAPDTGAPGAPPAPPAAPGPAAAAPGGSELGGMLAQILAGGEHTPPSIAPSPDAHPTPLPVPDVGSSSPGPGTGTATAKPVEKAEPGRIQATGREVEPRTPAGTPVKARYALVDANALTASHDAGGAVNPAFPAALQPRARDRKASQAQIQSIASKLDPTLLGEAPTTADGAPIVAPDGVVESGNGRTLALRQAYAKGGADNYRAWLKANAEHFGINPADVDAHQAPMLVRVRQGAATPEQRIQLARESNESTVARMGAAERATQDAAQLTPDDLAAYKPNEDGNVLGAGNQDFLNRFANRLPATERGDLLTADGRWSAEMARRVQGAIFAKAYESPDVVNLQAEEASPDVRNILTALNRAAPAFAALGDEGKPLREAVVGAVRKVRDAKRNGQALEEALRQSDLLGGQAPAADRIAAIFGQHNRSAARLTDFLEELAGVGAANQDRGMDSMFGDQPSAGATVDGAIDQASRKVADGGGDYGVRDTARGIRDQLGLFGHQPQPAGKRDRAPAPSSGDLFGGPSSRELTDAAGARKDANRNGLGRDEIPPSQGEGELFAGGRPEQGQLPPGGEHGGADPFDHEAGQRRVRNAVVDTWRPGAAPIHTASDAIAALAPLRRNAQEVLAALVLDQHDRPLSLVHLNRGTPDGAEIDFLSLYGAVADIPGAAKLWLAHNHPSGNASPSSADRRVTERVAGDLKGTGIELAGHVTLGGPRTGGAMLPDGGTFDRLEHQPLNRAGPSAPQIPVVARTLTGNRLGEGADKVTDPSAAPAVLDKHNPDQRPGVLLLDTRHQVLGFLPIEAGEAETLRNGRTDSGFTRLARAVHQQGARAAMIADPHGGERQASVGGNNLARALKALDVRVLDTFTREHGHGQKWDSLASTGRGTGDSQRFQSRMEPTGELVPAPLRQELERSLGRGTVDTLVQSGLLQIERGDGGHIQAEWDGQRIAAFEGNVPHGAALGVLLHEVSHAKLEEILGADGWAKAQRDYDTLLTRGDAVAKAAEARVQKADVAAEDLPQERLAYLVEEAAKRHPAPGVVGLVQRILGAFRRWAATSSVFKALERVGIKAPTLKPADFVAFAHRGLAELERTGERRIQRDRMVADLKAERGSNLVEDPRRYFQDGGELVSIDKLDATKAGRENSRAREFFARAAKGEIPKREPLTVRKVGDRYQVLNGNGTLAAAKALGWEKLPIREATWRDELPHAPIPEHVRVELRTLYRNAEHALPEFGERLRALARKLDLAHPLVAPLKGVGRAAEKVMADYGGDASKLKDLVRGTVVVDHPDQVEHVLESLRAAFGDVTVKRNTLAGAADASGYRDALAYVQVDGHQAEVQINVPEMIKAKEGPGHALYEKARAIDARAQGGKLSPEDMREVERLLEEQRAVYGAAWEATKRRNSASRMGVAERNDATENGRGDSPESQARQSPPPSGVDSNDTGTPSKSPNRVPAGNDEGSMSGASSVDGATVARPRASVRAEDVDARTRTGNLPLSAPPRPAAQPSEEAKRWTTKIREAFERRWEPLGKLPERDLYLDLRGLASGRIAQAGELASAIAGKLANIPKEDRVAVKDYLTTAGADPAAIADVGVRMAAQDAKLLIGKIGDALVARGLIPAESREKYRDAYLPRLYFAHLLKGDAWRAFGSGKGLSDQGYRKARNDEIPEEVRRVALGEVQDPAFLAAVAVAKPARDIALVDWLAQVSENRNWTLPEATVDWNGKRVTPYYLKDRADQLRQQARLYEDAESAAKARELADELDNLANQALAALGAVPETVRKDFKQVPDTAKYGPLRGLWTRSEIYEDVVGLARLMPQDQNWAERALGFGGWATKATQAWKFLKVAANPPSQIRNAVSNAIMLQLSGVPMHRIPALLPRAVAEIIHDGPAYLAAKKHGLTAGTFAQEELLKLHTDLLDLAKREGQLGVMGQVNLAGRRIVNALGSAYQATETVFKVAKMMDGMERRRLTPEAAAREAQKWLFDYSLVPQSVRYLRNAPVGAPFVTYAYKVLPRMLEVALEHPHRLAPYVALYYGWQYALAALLDQEPDDIDKLEAALPEWMQDRTGVLMMPWKDGQGRWAFLDTGYYLPWTMWWDSARHLAQGDANKAREDMGLISGPAVSVLAALTTGVDDFTGKPIANPADPAAKQWGDRLGWAWGLAAPPMLDVQHGALGRTLQAMQGDVDRDGNPKTTALQAALRYVGVNIYPTDLEASRDRNVRALVSDLQATMSQARRSLRDAQPRDRARLAEQYRTEIQARAKKLRDYQENTSVPEGLR